MDNIVYSTAPKQPPSERAVMLGIVQNMIDTQPYGLTIYGRADWMLDNMPKGVTYIIREQAAYPTMKRRRVMLPPIDAMKEKQTLSSEQYGWCVMFRSYWYAAEPRGCAVMKWDDMRVDEQWYDFDHTAISAIDKSECYTWLKVRMSYYAKLWIHSVVCWEKTLDETAALMKIRKLGLGKQFIEASDELGGLLEQMDIALNGRI